MFKALKSCLMAPVVSSASAGSASGMPLHVPFRKDRDLTSRPIEHICPGRINRVQADVCPGLHEVVEPCIPRQPNEEDFDREKHGLLLFSVGRLRILRFSPDASAREDSFYVKFTDTP